MKLVNHAAERILGHPREALVGAQFQDERWWCADGSGERDAAALLRSAIEQPELFHGELYVDTDAGRTALMRMPPRCATSMERSKTWSSRYATSPASGTTWTWRARI